MAITNLQAVRILIHDTASPQTYTDEEIEFFLSLYDTSISLRAALYSTAADLLDGMTAKQAQLGMAKVKIEGEVEVDTRPSSGGSAQTQAAQYRLLAENEPYSAVAELNCSIPQFMDMLENQWLIQNGGDYFG